MDPDRLAYGRYVVWDPPPDLPIRDLEPGHPGIIVGPFWQDVEVNWFFRESEDLRCRQAERAGDVAFQCGVPGGVLSRRGLERGRTRGLPRGQ
ncbi:hypothetical protein PA7_29600 [Pseudonocardia asaccharolytica DSM 44247 = NBRC 16224]|uniref:Uncharacterized protein n=1 Tax=Pseudonocardia asaccharolytica DSM 44247 = NBRC 16224 TaxID=1123024 RepID=A0A511D3N9_9PSEU|nr:hypothetical protein PA7_29600 [Pseudonocardia asaccharolytica DSM 44247 = NBRC 16224]